MGSSAWTEFLAVQQNGSRTSLLLSKYSFTSIWYKMHHCFSFSSHIILLHTNPEVRSILITRLQNDESQNWNSNQLYTDLYNEISTLSDLFAFLVHFNFFFVFVKIHNSRWFPFISKNEEPRFPDLEQPFFSFQLNLLLFIRCFCFKNIL